MDLIEELFFNVFAFFYENYSIFIYSKECEPGFNIVSTDFWFLLYNDLLFINLRCTGKKWLMGGQL